MHKFEVYQDKAGEWRWRFSFNEKIMADSGEGYTSKQHAKRALRLLGLKMLISSVTVKS